MLFCSGGENMVWLKVIDSVMRYDWGNGKIQGDIVLKKQTFN